MISICLLLVGGELSFQSPLIGPCLHTHTALEKGLILKPEITTPNPARGRHLFLKPDLGQKPKFTEGVLRNAQLWGNKKRCV